jgi:hypothetical protein
VTFKLYNILNNFAEFQMGQHKKGLTIFFSGNTEGGSITVPLTSYLTGLELGA